jgi:uncharacterized membrane protein YGL010W
MNSTVDQLLKNCRGKHVLDLQVYRKNHQEKRNRVLHWIMIPFECFSALLFATLLHPGITIVTGIFLGILSIIIATKPWLGVASFAFHLLAVWICATLVASNELWEVLLIAMGTWAIAWILQVGVGHWILEGNRPNIANLETVSLLATVQSVLIAWSS